MAFRQKHSTSIFLKKTFWIIFLVFHEFNLVKCDDFDDDNLKKALEVIDRREKDLELQENEFSGQPENIGYGFQKTLGFFDGDGSFSSYPKNENDFQSVLFNYQREEDEGNGKSNFRERISNYRKTYGQDSDRPTGMEYLKMLKNFWSKYGSDRGNVFNADDFADEQLEKFIKSTYGEDDEQGSYEIDYASLKPVETKQLESTQVRNRKNYRVFANLNGRSKRYPSFGEGFYGKRYTNLENANYENPMESNFFYYKNENPEFYSDNDSGNNVRRAGFDLGEDEKDGDIVRMLNDAFNRQRYGEEVEDEEEDGDEDVEDEDGVPYWSKVTTFDDGFWLPGPVAFSGDLYEDSGRNEKRAESATRYFKPHNGIHLNAKKVAVKRSSIRVRKDVKNDKISKELKGIFATPTTTKPVSPSIKKGSNEKKPTENVKKQNMTKPATTKHRESKKVVRSVSKYTEEQGTPMRQNQDIVDLFKLDKKSVNQKKAIDWSQYFGIDKRSQTHWLEKDYLRLADSHLKPGEKKRFSPHQSQYEIPFDTRRFTKKNYFPADIGTNIDKVEDKIGDIEGNIIDDTLKFTGAHSDKDVQDLGKIKGKIIERLQAAYSLEKMKKALEEFKNLIRSDIGQKSSPKKSTAAEGSKAGQETKAASPKETVHSEKVSLEKIEKNKKRMVVVKEGIKDIFGNREPLENLHSLDEPYYNKIEPYSFEECPVYSQAIRNCLRIEPLTGKYADLLLPLCSLQQICNLCGSELGFMRASTCDSMFLTAAQNMCQGDSECLLSAKESLVALEDIYEQDFEKNRRPKFLGTCLSNTCLQKFLMNVPENI